MEDFYREEMHFGTGTNVPFERKPQSSKVGRSDAPLAQWIRADDYGSSGRGFKSLMAHHLFSEHEVSAASAIDPHHPVVIAPAHALDAGRVAPLADHSGVAAGVRRTF